MCSSGNNLHSAKSRIGIDNFTDRRSNLSYSNGLNSIRCGNCNHAHCARVVDSDSLAINSDTSHFTCRERLCRRKSQSVNAVIGSTFISGVGGQGNTRHHADRKSTHEGGAHGLLSKIHILDIVASCHTYFPPNEKPYCTGLFAFAAGNFRERTAEKRTEPYNSFALYTALGIRHDFFRISAKDADILTFCARQILVHLAKMPFIPPNCPKTL